MLNRSRKYLYTCFLVGFLTGGCYSIDPITVSPEPQDTDSHADADTDTDTGSDTDTDSDTETDCDDDWCEYWCEYSGTVPSEPPETPAQQALICAESSNPVQSNTAAWVILNSTSNNFATGHIAIPPDLIDHVIGTPIIEVIFAYPTAQMQMNVTSLQLTAWGFDFNASWDGSVTDMQIQVTLELDCASADAGIFDAGTGPDAGGDTRMVQSLTNLSWCFNYDNEASDECEFSGWVSSGEPCFETGENCHDSC